MSEAVLYEMKGQVAVVTINQPDRRNALSTAVRQGLFEAWDRFEKDENAKVAILTGTGEKAFCAGMDLKEASATSLKVPPRGLVPIIGDNVHLTKPTIAAVNGVAYAGGFLLAQNCDLVIAAESARFAVTEVKVGRGSPWAAPLSWLVGPRVALEILLTGDPLTAARAYEVGLVNRVVPDAGLRAEAQALAERIAGNAPLSVRAAKKTAYLSARMGIAEAFTEAEQIWAPVYLSDDAQEGPAAFRDKRPPAWTGR